MVFLSTRSFRALVGVAAFVLVGCGGSEVVPFLIDIDTSKCGSLSKYLANIELSIAAFEGDPERLCELKTATASVNASPQVEVGSAWDGEEIVVTAVMRSHSDCVSCYGLLRLLLRPDLTKHVLELVDAPSCVIPNEARNALGLPEGELPPKTACR